MQFEFQILGALAIIEITMVGGTIVALDVLQRLRRTNGHVLVYDDIPIEGVTSEADRKKLLKFHRRIEDALQPRRKFCAFLSIDIVGSTVLKEGERQVYIDQTFISYEQMVRSTVKAYGVWKYTWTPDGMMAAFNEVRPAVEAAKQVIRELPHFNEKSSSIKTPIRVRCGLAQGEVAIYEDTDLERVANQAIDFAGHCQKQAPNDSLVIGSMAYSGLADKSGFAEWKHRVDNNRVYIWRPERADNGGH